MSNALLPLLPGLEWTWTRSPMHVTTIKSSVSGREFRSRHMASPRYTYHSSYEFLRDKRQSYDELSQLLGFFNARHGSFDDFLFDDTDDNTATAQQFGVGDGATVLMQLVRSYGGFAEPVYALNGAPQIFANGVLKTVGTHYSIDSFGALTWVTAPAAGVVCTWSGAFYWRCRFVDDQIDFVRFAWKLWNLQTFDFITTKP